MFKRKGAVAQAGLAVLALLLLLPENLDWTQSTTTVDAVAKNPIEPSRYQNYQFGGPGDAIIDAGFQPVAIPTGTVPAVMVHDRVLAQELAVEGKKLTFHPFLDGADANTYLFSGRLECMWAGDMPTILAASRRAIVVTAQVKTSFASIVARDLQTMEQLKNRRIGYTLGSSAHHVLLQGLARYHMDEYDVHMVRMPVNRMIPALQNGTIDAFVAWEPIPSMAQETIKDLSTPYRALVQSYFYFARHFSDSHPNLVRIMTAANLRAVRWLSQSRDHIRQGCRWHIGLANAFLHEPYMISVDQCIAIVQRDLLDPLPMTALAMDTLKQGGLIFQQVQFLKNLGLLSPESDPDRIWDAFDPGILAEIIKEQDRWKINKFDYSM
ncbi:MAG: ABC transporter substrate-binding protein [Magnetococcales bacterium]|nr:ABC transporter substrate-binding protein [Magnetococcales bacterium]